MFRQFALLFVLLLLLAPSAEAEYDSHHVSKRLVDKATPWPENLSLVDAFSTRSLPISSSNYCDTDSLRQSVENSSVYETESFYKQTDSSDGNVEDYGETQSGTERVGFRTEQGDNEDADRVLRGIIQWDLSTMGIPEDASICEVSIKIDTYPDQENKFSLQKWGLESKPIGGTPTPKEAFEEIGSGTTYLSDSTFSDGVFDEVIGSESLRSEVKQQLGTGLDEGWLAVGIKNANEDDESKQFAFALEAAFEDEPIRLKIDYALPPDPFPSVIASDKTVNVNQEVDGVTTIKSGATLTVKSGVKFLMESGSGFVVNSGGKIVANGATFTSKGDGQNTTWKNIVVRGDNSVFKNVEIKDAGGGCSSSCPALEIAAEGVDITNAHIHDSGHRGHGDGSVSVEHLHT